MQDLSVKNILEGDMMTGLDMSVYGMMELVMELSKVRK